MSGPTDWITGTEIRERTGWNAQQLRRRIAAGEFPTKVDFDRWNRAEVEARLAGKWPLDAAPKADEGSWTVDPEAIRKAHAEITRRAKEAAAAERRRRRKGVS
ncbi:hypothetical protein U91I_03433 [alpha proteobacterium U9-1i]|nr:hypothetical protein U91I_03433 [alpha proteobacterium U9-1i]